MRHPLIWPSLTLGFEPEIFEILETIERGRGGEIQLTDGLKTLLESQKIFAYEFEGKRYDTGSKLGFLQDR